MLGKVLLITFVVFVAIRGTTAILGDSQKITFPNPRDTANYARLATTLTQPLSTFTLCLHMRTDMTESQTAGVISYANGNHDNELLLYNNGGGFQLYIAGRAGSAVRLPVWDGLWHEICATWRNTDGDWELYVDGVLTGSGSGLSVGDTVGTGGTFILGQEQDTVGGGFVTSQAFTEELSEVNLWDRVLSPADIGIDWTVLCNRHGNVIDWSTTDIDVFGQASSVRYLNCDEPITRQSLLGDMQKIIFPDPRDLGNYARLMTKLGQDLDTFTLCLHMRTDMTSDQQASLVSYATADEANELLIYNNGNGFQIYVAGKGGPAVSLPVWDGLWHEICATWRSSDGAWQLYADGVVTGSGSGLSVGRTVTAGGNWILAHEQDTVGGGFDPKQIFTEEMSQVNLWDHVLSPAEIGSDWSMFCGRHGNVIDWSTTNIEVFGEAGGDLYHDCGVMRGAVLGDKNKILFPNPRSTGNYARLMTTLGQDLTSFTLCLHMRTDMTADLQAGVISYATLRHHNELLLYNNGQGFQLYVAKWNTAPVSLPVWDGLWHAVCATWRNSDGAWQLYTDGVLSGSGSGLNVGGTVRSGGRFILAQDQDTVGGGFVQTQAFTEEVSQVNLWDRVLSAAEIGTEWSEYCGLHGNVIDWSVTTIEVFGQASSDRYLNCVCCLDIVFVVDVSSSVRLVNFYSGKTFIKNFLQCFTWRHDVGFGAITFDCVARTSIALNTYPIDASLLYDIDMYLVFDGGLSRPGLALRYMRTTSDFRDAVPRAAVLMSDGNSQSNVNGQVDDYAAQADAARLAGIELYSVAIGNPDIVDNSALETIAGDATRVFDLNSPCDLANRIVADLCTAGN